MEFRGPLVQIKTKEIKKDLKSINLSTFSLVILFCFFFSGLASLIYQILWLRMIDKVIGSAPFAVATVRSIFMGRLALGSWLAGRYIDRIGSRNNLHSLYGKAELAIGIYSLLFPFLTYAVSGESGRWFQSNLREFDNRFLKPVISCFYKDITHLENL